MTTYIVILTVVVTVIAFYRPNVFNKLQFNPYLTFHHSEYYRMISHALIHADWLHLIINMFVLYSFGNLVENYFYMFHEQGMIKFPELYFIFFYLTSIIVASISTLKNNKDNPIYNSVGASGGVSAIIFASIFFDPWQKLYFYFFIPIPGILFGAIYLIYSRYMSRRKVDYINHDAHYWGALYGFIFPLCIEPKLFMIFINRLTHYI